MLRGDLHLGRLPQVLAASPWHSDVLRLERVIRERVIRGVRRYARRTSEQHKLGKPQILCLGGLLFAVFHGIRREFEGSSRKSVEQNALDVRVSHRGFPKSGPL